MKKTLYKISALLGVTAIVFFAASCLKDDRFVDFSKVSTVVELLDAAPGGAGVVQAPLVASALPDTIWVRVNQTGQFALDKDLTVTLAIGTAADLAVYNADTLHAPGEMLPDSALLPLPSTTLVIPKGKRAGSWPILVASGEVDLTHNFILPVKITDAQGQIISGNFGLILFHVTVKNIYDGQYHSIGDRWSFAAAADWPGDYPPTGWVSHPTWDFPSTHIGTVDATTSSVHVGNSDGGFGTMNITVNPDNTVTIASTGDTGVANLVPLSPAPGPSTYDPATGTFTLYYMYTNASGTFRILHDVLVYVGP